jgi:hypothetical protein
VSSCAWHCDNALCRAAGAITQQPAQARADLGTGACIMPILAASERALPPTLSAACVVPTSCRVASSVVLVAARDLFRAAMSLSLVRTTCITPVYIPNSTDNRNHCYRLRYAGLPCLVQTSIHRHTCHMQVHLSVLQFRSSPTDNILSGTCCNASAAGVQSAP